MSQCRNSSGVSSVSPQWSAKASWCASKAAVDVEFRVELVDADACRHDRGRRDACEVDPHQLETADLAIAGCHEKRPDGGVVGERARVDHNPRAGRGELEEPASPPLVLGEDPGAQTAPVPREADHPERKDLDVRRAADEREPGADLPAWRLDDRDVALAVDDRVAPVPEHLVGRPDRRAEMKKRLLVDELGRTLGILVAGRPQAEPLRETHTVPIADINKTGLPKLFGRGLHARGSPSGPATAYLRALWCRLGGFYRGFMQERPPRAHGGARRRPLDPDWFSAWQVRGRAPRKRVGRSL